jgi:hypothetical protein
MLLHMAFYVWVALFCGAHCAIINHCVMVMVMVDGGSWVKTLHL